MNNTLIIIDSNYVCHVARHSMGDLSWDEMRTGIIFGFFKQILSLAKKFDTNKFAFVWDSSYSLRKEIYPQYKENRKKPQTEEEKKINGFAYNQFNLLKNELLNKVGFENNFCFRGYEGDDLIASILQNNFFLENIIVSSDNDLYQLLESGNRNISMYSINKKDLYMFADFVGEWNILPYNWSRIKAIAGCKGDNVVGISGVGEKTAIKFWSGNMKRNTTYWKIERSDLPTKNIPLVELPFEGTPRIILKPFEDLHLSDFIDVFEMYNFQSQLTKESLNKWKTILNLK